MFLTKRLAVLTATALIFFGAAAQTATPDSSQEAAQSISYQRENRGLSDMKTHIVPKGQWVFGGSLTYSTHTNSDYSLLIINDISSNGYSFKVSPMIGYSLVKNSIIGVRGVYSRSHLTLDSASLNLGEGDAALNFGVDYYYMLKHSYDVAAIWRQYIPLGRNKRFAIFNEVQLAMGGAQSKYAQDSPVNGTYSKSFEAGLSVSPGIIAFASNTMAIEVSVGVMGIQLNSTKQLHNQVEEGKTTTSFMNFSINLLSIGLGVSFYL